MNLIEELSWRGLIHDMTPGTEKLLNKKQVTGYIGIDPTATSLHVGNLVQIMLLLHFQRYGHQPIALLGGATGLVGDPSGKSEERQLMSEDELEHNLDCIKKQLEQFLDFDKKDNPAEILSNYDWFKDMSFLDFIREVGKHITVNYMMAKDSVKNRLDTGMSFTEFSYQLVQGYDFYWLWKNKDCQFQMGGSDQWGNITTGIELIRRKEGGEAFALTSPLLTQADGTKFGKTEGGNIWLDPDLTSPYKFYQFWINTSDEDASKYIRMFTLKSREEVEALEKEHQEAPHKRVLQKELAKEVTILVHSEAAYELALKATKILFGKETTDVLKSTSEKELLQIFEGVPRHKASRSVLENGNNLIPFLADESEVFSSRGEVRRSIKNNALRINKERIQDQNRQITKDDLLNNKYLLVQKGKKNYYLVVVE